MKFSRKFFVKTILIFVFCFSPVCMAQAAKLFLEQVKTRETLGSEENVHVELKFDSRGQIINAIEGTMLYPDDVLSLDKMSEEDSILSYWVKQPDNSEAGKITFSGIAPGGFNGAEGMILAFDFSVKQESLARLEVKDVRVLLNDGKATELATLESGVDINIMIDNESVQAEGKLSAISDDNTPPEEFSPVVSRHQDLFYGQWFVSFYAKDDNFGIDHYEIFESRKRIEPEKIKDEDVIWENAQSPSLLKDQSLESHVYVKAVDRAGNETIGWTKPRKDLAEGSETNSAPWWRWGAVLFVSAIIAIILTNRMDKKRKTNHV